MNVDPVPPSPQTEQEVVEAIASLARSYSLLRRTDQDSKYEFNEVASAIKRLAKRIGVDDGVDK